MKENLEKVRKRIAKAAADAGRDPGSVRLVAVTKTVPASRVKTAIQAGADIFGENYVQEAREKIDALSQYPVSWHFIGHLQSNKAKYVVKLFDLIHSVDSEKLAGEIHGQAKKIHKIQDILVQVNIGKEEQKFGIDPRKTHALLEQIRQMENLRVKGFMTMPPFFNEPERVRPFFKALRELSEKLAEKFPPDQKSNIMLKELSMGMTGDFEAAVREGATLVRIGTAIFGKRD